MTLQYNTIHAYIHDYYIYIYTISIALFNRPRQSQPTSRLATNRPSLVAPDVAGVAPCRPSRPWGPLNGTVGYLASAVLGDKIVFPAKTESHSVWGGVHHGFLQMLP